MEKKMPVLVTVLIVVLAVIITFCATDVVLSQRYQAKINGLVSSYGVYNDLYKLEELIDANFIGKKNEEYIHDGILNGYIYGLDDPYAEYFTKSEYESFVEQMSGTAVGVGINVIYSAADNTIEVLSTVVGSPAEKSGILPGDFIVAVDGKEVSEIGYYGASALIKGQEGTTVKLTCERDGVRTDYDVQRTAISIDTASVIPLNAEGVGMVRITEFGGNTPALFESAVNGLKDKGINKFIFDLRNNGGGDLSSIVAVLDFILPSGPITSISYANGEKETFASDEKWIESEKIAVLVNDKTASAAELFAAAIRDYAEKGQINAKVVGTKTYGKGVLQKYFALPSGKGYVKFSVGSYDPPYSENYDGIGILPDISVDLSDSQKEINFNKLTEGNDDQLDAAIRYIQE